MTDTNAVKTVSIACLELMRSSYILSVRSQACRAMGIILRLPYHKRRAYTTSSEYYHIGEINEDGEQLVDEFNTFGKAVLQVVLELISETTSNTLHFPLETLTVVFRTYGNTQQQQQQQQQSDISDVIYHSSTTPSGAISPTMTASTSVVDVVTIGTSSGTSLCTNDFDSAEIVSLI